MTRKIGGPERGPESCPEGNKEVVQELGPERGRSPDRNLDRGPERGPEGDKEGVQELGPEGGPHFVPSHHCTHLTPVRFQVQLLVPDEVITVKEKQSVIYNDRNELYKFSHTKIKVQKHQSLS